MMRVNKGKSWIDIYFTQGSFQIEFTGEWEEENEWKERFTTNKYEALYYMGFLSGQEELNDKNSVFTRRLLYLQSLSETLIKKLSCLPEIEFTREETEVSLTDEEISLWQENIPYSIGVEFVNEQWIEGIWGKLLDIFREEIKKHTTNVASYFTERNPKLNVAGRVFFHLVENKNDEGLPFAFLATYSIKPGGGKKAVHTPLKNALIEFKNDDKKLIALMATVIKAAEKSDLISELMESGELFMPLKFTVAEAYAFLKEIPIYEVAGIMCRVPNWWKKRSKNVRLTVKVGEKEPSALGIQGILKFSPVLTVDGEALTKEEIAELIGLEEGLTFYKGKWIEVNRKKLDELLVAFEKVESLADKDSLSIGEAMRMELGLKQSLGLDLEDEEIELIRGTWLRNLRERMSNPQRSNENTPLAPTFKANLRPYQQDGYMWLSSMAKLGFGACLADDMGLGKTVQVIAFLEYMRTATGGRVLLVLPASLLGNWENEIRKFAPDMEYRILHSSAGNSESKVFEKGADVDMLGSSSTFLYITTYAMAVKLEGLRNISWDAVILDEAQAIKNAGTKQTKGVKLIPASLRIAMTGTPIENNLGDLWSIFDFLNPGLLGSSKDFIKFADNAMKEDGGYGALKKTINPFILRRLKTDKTIITDLPEKIEIKDYTALSKKQVALYEKLLKDLLEKLDESEGIERKGQVLASLSKLKQICNHPDQYLGQDEFKIAASGKFELLEEICETISEKRERVLIFTQFREMTEPLSHMLTKVFGKKGLVLHGGTSVKDRSKLVEQFNGEEYVPYMVLSLKAGGIGLNLTAANHVIHFDRWWNPAVENQATDRAFRIGQKKNVMVHKFVTKGTIEEKIDEMIEKKQQTAGELLATSGEKWLTELNNKELMELLQFGGDGK